MTTQAALIRLAPNYPPKSGRCSCCSAAAMSWYRTGIIADGRIVVAAMYCADHDPDSHGTGQQLGTLTVADVARIAPRRAQRAAKNLAAARAKATAHSRVSANLAGASSHTHTHALLAGVASEEAETLERLAALAR